MFPLMRQCSGTGVRVAVGVAVAVEVAVRVDVAVAVGIAVAEGKGGYVAAAAAAVVAVGVSVDVCKTIGTTVCTAAGSRVEVTVAVGVSATAAPCTVEAGGVGVDVDSRTGTAVGAAVGVVPVGDGATTAGGSGVGVDEGREVTLTNEITASTAVGTTTMSAASAVGLADIGVAVAACNSLISIGATVEVGAGVTALTVGTVVSDTETPAADVTCSLTPVSGESSHAMNKDSKNASATSQTHLASLPMRPPVRPT